MIAISSDRGRRSPPFFYFGGTARKTASDILKAASPGPGVKVMVIESLTGGLTRGRRLVRTSPRRVGDLNARATVAARWSRYWEFAKAEAYASISESLDPNRSQPQARSASRVAAVRRLRQVLEGRLSRLPSTTRLAPSSLFAPEGWTQSWTLRLLRQSASPAWRRQVRFRRLLELLGGGDLLP